MTGGVGPWLPFQMLVSAWIGMGAGSCRGGSRGGAELAVPRGLRGVAAYALRVLDEPVELALHPRDRRPGPRGYLSYVAGAPLVENLHRFGIYTLLTSTGSWDTGRAITTSVALIVLGPAILTTLRRASRRSVITRVWCVAAPTSPQPPG